MAQAAPRHSAALLAPGGRAGRLQRGLSAPHQPPAEGASEGAGAGRLTCDLCGEPMFACVPGSMEVWSAGMLLNRGVPMRCWCETHWWEAHQ